MSLSAEEQLAFEIINRARLDPLREMQRLGLDLNADLAPGTLNGGAKQVLAPNALLESAAEGHGGWMLQSGVFSHTGQGGTSAGDRMEQSGYLFTGAWGRGENLAYYRSGGAPLDMAEVMPAHLDGLFQSASHRKNLFKDDYRELGMSEVNGTNAAHPRPTSYLVQNFAYSGTASFLTGVVYQDRDGDQFYDIGEGAADTRITLGGVSALSAAAGGYALGGIEASGYQRVTVAGAGQPLVFALEFRGLNVKLDIVDDSKIHVATSVRLHEGVTEARLLGIEALQLTGGAGNEALHGNAAANLIQGGAGDDVIWGYGGNDTLRGDGGNDTIYGGAGDDNIGGGAGNDLIWGESGANVIWAGAGNDTVQGGTGNDTIYGGAGRNRLLGNDGDDLIYASPGGDFMAGGAGNDRIYGAAGNDTIYLGLGDDFVGGGGGNDLIYGGAGQNRIYGGAGNDTLVAGTGRDVMTGGPGEDVFVFVSAKAIGIGAGRDMVTDFTPGTDKIDLRGLSSQFNETGGLSRGTASFYYHEAGGLLIGDQDGDGKADWVLHLAGAPKVTAADFLL